MIGAPVPRTFLLEVQKEDVSSPTEPEVSPRAAPNGDASARIRAAVDAHHDFLWRQVRRFGTPAGDVDDVVQQAFVVFAQRIRDIVPGAERAFLYAAGRNAASNQRRVSARRRESWDESAVDAAADPARSVEDIGRARSLIDHLLEGMDDDLRAVLVLHEVEEMTVPEIAVLLEIPAGTAASRLRRAREDVSARLHRHGFKAASGASA